MITWNQRYRAASVFLACPQSGFFLVARVECCLGLPNHTLNGPHWLGGQFCSDGMRRLLDAFPGWWQWLGAHQPVVLLLSFVHLNCECLYISCDVWFFLHSFVKIFPAIFFDQFGSSLSKGAIDFLSLGDNTMLLLFFSC